MKSILSPKLLASTAGISGAYASLILAGKRPCSSDIALAAFRAHGIRLGLLAEMSDDDINKLCGRCDHGDGDTAADPAPSCGKADQISAAAEFPEAKASGRAVPSAGAHPTGGTVGFDQSEGVAA